MKLPLKLRTRWNAFWIGVGLLASSATGAEKPVALINSDGTIELYRQVETEFKANLARPITIADLSQQTTDQTLAAFKSMPPDILFCIGSKAYMSAKTYTANSKTPIVFSSIINYLRHDIGPNTFGISHEISPAMQLMTYRYLFPDIRKIGILYSESYSQEWMRIAKAAAAEVGIEIIGQPVEKPKHVNERLAKIIADVDALWFIADPVVGKESEVVVEIFKQADRHQKPIFTFTESLVDNAVLVISADTPTVGRQAAGMVEDILTGREIDAPIQGPAGSHIILNMKNVEKYKLNLNLDALDSVNQIIR